MQELLTVLTITALSGRFFYQIVQSYDPGSSLFSWHPTCMILAQIVALESVLLFKYIPRSWRVTIHGIIAGVATCLFCAGFYAIYQNKINLGKSHFTSWHGLFGVLTLTLMVSQSLFGTILKYGKKILQKVGAAKLVKTGHRVNGLFSLVMSFVVVMLVTGDWFYCVTVAIPGSLYVLRVLLKRFNKKIGLTKKSD